MWTTPEKHTKKRETLRSANQNKIIDELGTRRCMKKAQRKHSELKEPDEMLNKTKTLTTTARQTKAKEKALK